jgi:xanthine dehydrogenase accessory factor
MRKIAADLRRWYHDGATVGLATVVRVSGSVPRQPGASMAVGPNGAVVGSVSGGCVEGAVYELAQQVISSGEPVLRTFGYSDDDAFAVGLTCGGEITLYVEPVSSQRQPWLGDVFASLDAGEPVALARVVDGSGRSLGVWAERSAGSLGNGGLDAAVSDDARGLLSAGQTGERHYGPRGERRRDEVTVFVQAFAPPPRLYVFGAIDFAAAVVRIGAFLGYTVTVCDARPVFATRSRFPAAHDVVVEWPHRFLARVAAQGGVDERSVITVLTHDPKFDVPLLEIALRTPAAYVGAMGSRRTHEDRLDRLRERGMTATELARLRSPIGLDLGARTPEETAVSIAAEIIQCRWGGSGRPLATTVGTIHRSAGTASPAGP